ncbi:MAG: hypothetical protein IT209_12075 [Armatimonadetes bacterium]|nr:hypothetical protein [Armatimonadota bacterium]
MGVQDAETTRMVRREIIRRHLDDSQLQVNAMHGVVYLRGILKVCAGHPRDLKEEMLILHRVLRSRPGIRDVIFELLDR